MNKKLQQVKQLLLSKHYPTNAAVGSNHVQLIDQTPNFDLPVASDEQLLELDGRIQDTKEFTRLVCSLRCG